ncbi:molybdopterin-dependent oxidoreductase [Bacteriovoracaceae bacterium]|nr:molybdopterin-dependent oxidoreductase [Bacteriovoracaceae bacterium]
MKKKIFADEFSSSHTQGKTIYVDDIAPVVGEVHLYPVLSTIAKGKVADFDLTQVETDPNFINFFSAKDIKDNAWGPMIADQPFFANKIQYYGEIIGLIAAKTPASSRQLAKKVKVEYQEAKPILSIQEAIKKKSFLCDTISFISPKKYKNNIDDVGIVGEFHIGGQEHFYLETQAARVTYSEGNHLKIESSTQHPTEVQHICSKMTNIPYSQITVEVNKLGGGFGGKESQASHIAALCALASVKLQKTCRLILDRDEDFQITGKRHPFYHKYKIIVSPAGQIRHLKVDMYSDGGAYLDLSLPILQRGMFHVDNCYYIPHYEINGRIAKTNKVSNTAFRGFGGPQGAALIEMLMERIGQHLELDPYQVRQINLYQKNKLTTPYGQKIKHNFLPEIFSDLAKKSAYQSQRKKIKKLNSDPTSEWLYGMSMTGTKFGISFTAKFLNQGNALINILPDGTMQASTGAIEMGQGVSHKIRKILSDYWGLTPERIFMLKTNTEKNANTSATAASSGTDINASAALIASEKIKNRLMDLYYSVSLLRKKELMDESKLKKCPKDKVKKIKFANNTVQGLGKLVISFQELTSMAYMNRVSLCDYGHYKTEKIWFDDKTKRGNPFLYYSTGAVNTVVKINKFTGEIKVQEAKILMDLGRPVDEKIDRGQIMGAYIQAQGWVTTEELIHRPDGFLATHSPTTYKIPNIQDIPRKFSVDFFPNETNTANVAKSKAVGEPPFLLGTSVYTAIMDALHCGKKNELSLPFTGENILDHLS